MVLSEVMFYEGLLSQTPRPSEKMQSPRSPNPLRVSCSSFSSQHTHCFRAFDRVQTSAWVTNGGGSVNGMLLTPQWLLLDLGEGHGARPTGLRILCDQENLETSTGPKACPKTFSVLGSHDNVKFDLLHRVDMDKYDLQFREPGGAFFPFHPLDAG